ncbi:MAG: drug efflux transport system permease protein, partial [Bacteroidota bacterium]|nr:drug efflux transport system permease protein [Bacteroidota bacterium]
MNKRNKNIKDIVNPNQLLSRFNPRGFGALKFLLEKEFKQILRNKFLIRVIIFLPLISLSLLPMVANFEIKNNNLAVIDNDHSPSSSLFIRKIVSSGHFHLVSVRQNYNDALNDIEQDRADVILEIPAFFEKDLMTTYSAQVNVTA